MRPRIQVQRTLDYNPSNLKVTNEYYAKYEAISQVLDDSPKILGWVHQDLAKLLKAQQKEGSAGRRCSYASDTVLRILICQIIEGERLRSIVVRIDDSHFLRRFVRVDDGPMMDFTTLCKLKNAIRPETWRKINQALTASAYEAGMISGEALRLDTTAVETNIHWPTDSGLLWDIYRVLARWIRQAREIDPEAVGTGRLQEKVVKRLHTWIARKAGKKKGAGEAVKERYGALIAHIEGILGWAEAVGVKLTAGVETGLYTIEGRLTAERLLEEFAYYEEIGGRVVSQTRRRVMHAEKVPATEKIYSIFEPHTELLKRGRAQKPIEFGHMILIQQVEEKYITDYKVYRKRPVESDLIDPALESHCKLFESNPETLAADKGFYADMPTIRELEEEIGVVSIAKKGKRTREETLRETSPEFKLGQKFRAGIEGTISCLKRALGMTRCLNRGWEHFASTVGMTIFTHNLLILARGYG